MMDINTYGELKKMLPATGNGKVPGIRQLREKAKVLLVKETTTGRIEIFDNGFFTFEECGCTTVFGVDRCERPELYHVEGNVTLDFSSYPWDLILESAASSRLEHNANYREDYRMEIPLD